MENFDYESFKAKYVDKKRRTFFEYIDDKLEKNDKKYILENMTEDQIISSLEYYISTGVKYQITANNYFTYLTMLFDDLYKTYGIGNRIFVDKRKYEKLAILVKEKVKKLNEKEIKEIAPDDVFYVVQDDVRRELKSLVKQLREENTESSIFMIKNVSNLMSLIAINLIFDYGFKGKVITTIKLSDYDINKNTLTINSVRIKLRDIYQEAVSIYLKQRKHILVSNNEDTDYFFINTIGKSYTVKKSPDYSGLFSYLKNNYNHVSTNQYAFNKVIKFIHKGVDVVTLSKITGHSLEKIIQLLEYYNDEIKNLSAEDYFTQAENEKEKISIDSIDGNYMMCPNCGRKVISNATEWVVVIYEDENIPRLVCKHCGGKDEKDYI